MNPFPHPRDTLTEQAHTLFKKTIPTKRSKTESRRSQKKLCKSRRMGRRWFTPSNVVKPTFTSPPALVTLPPLPEGATTGTSIFEQPSNKMVQAQPEIGQSKQILDFCPLCTPVSRKCPSNYLSSNHPGWSEPEEEKSDWEEDIQKEEERRNERNKTLRTITIKPTNQTQSPQR